MASRSWNRVELIGNLTRDPELRYTPQGTAVVTFSIATNRTFVSDGERKEEADFHRIVAWNKLAELCSQLLKKGNRVFVSGRLQNRSWEGQDGQTRYVTEIVIEDMILLTPKNGYSEAVPEDISVDVPVRKSPPVVVSVPETEIVESSSSAKASGDKDEKPKKEEAPSEKKAEKVVNEDPGDLDDLPF